jgi:hypothetical protein
MAVRIARTAYLKSPNYCKKCQILSIFNVKISADSLITTASEIKESFMQSEKKKILGKEGGVIGRDANLNESVISDLSASLLEQSENKNIEVNSNKNSVL